MTKSLKLRTLFFGFLISLSLFLGFYYLNYINTKKHHLNELKETAYEVTFARTEFLAFHLWNLNKAELELTASNLLKKDPEFCGIHIFDTEKNINFKDGVFKKETIKTPKTRVSEYQNYFLITHPVNYKFGEEIKKIGTAIHCYSIVDSISDMNKEIIQSSLLILLLAICILSLNYFSSNLIFVIFDEFRVKLATLSSRREKITTGRLVKYNETKEISNTFNNIIDELDNKEKDLIEKKMLAEMANKAKTEFLSNMSHELRTPMHAISNYANLGLEKVTSNQPEKLAKYFNNINTSTERLLSLINNLLDLSKIEAGKMNFEFKKHNINELIDDVISEVEPLYKNKKIDIISDNSRFSGEIKFDSNKIHQVILNILSNAIKFSPEGSQIRISLKELVEDGINYIKFSIADQGVGIPYGELTKIFDKFEQSSKTKTGSGGTGLGLAICKEIVEAHKGKIWAENNPDIGSTINFMIPLNL